MKYVLVLLVLLLSSCGAAYKDSAQKSCPEYGRMDRLAELWGMIPKYKVAPTRETVSGIKIDPSMNMVSLAAFDEYVREVDACMYRQFGTGNGLLIPKDVTNRGHCVSSSPGYPIDHSCVTIKIPDFTIGWHYGPTGTQLLNWEAPKSSCEGKPNYNPDYPCYWRAGMQDGHTLVTVPECSDLASWYIRVFYGCQNPWGHPALAACASQGGLKCQ